MRVRKLLQQSLLVILGLTLLFGCVGPFKRGPRSITGLAQEYVVLQGKLAGAPQLKEGGDLLEIYLGLGEKETAPNTELIDSSTGEEIEMPPAVDEEQRFESIKYCIAFNEEEKKRLKNAADLMTVSIDRPVFLYAKMIQGRKFKWFYDGLDCVVYAVGVYHPQARKYVTLDTTYGLTWADAFSFKAFIRTAVKQGGKAAMKVAPLP